MKEIKILALYLKGKYHGFYLLKERNLAELWLSLNKEFGKIKEEVRYTEL